MRKFLLLLVISFLLPNCFGGDDRGSSKMEWSAWKCIESGNPIDGYKTVAQVVAKKKNIVSQGWIQPPDTLVLSVYQGEKDIWLFANFRSDFSLYFESGESYMTPQGWKADSAYTVPFVLIQGPSDTLDITYNVLRKYRELEFLKALNGNGQVYVRADGGMEYGINDYEFSLSGSRKALKCALK